MDKPEDLKKLSGLFKGVGIIFGIVLAIIIFQTYTLWQIRTAWIQTSGQVVKTSKKGWWDDDIGGRYYLQYQYEAGDRTYTGVRFHIKEDSIKRYTYLIRKYKKGDVIPVWYNPHKPEEAVINTDYLRNAFALMTVLAGFIFMAATMIRKENIWMRLTQHMDEALPRTYGGDSPLPESAIIKDNGNILRLNTGMSVFWRFGVPFLFFSFVTLACHILFLDELNPTMDLMDYSTITAVSWLISLGCGVFITAGFSTMLIVDSTAKKLIETRKRFFNTSTAEYGFSQAGRVMLHRERWRETYTLRNWTLYIEKTPSPSIFVSFRHRDIQPAGETYLGHLKKRLDYLIFGGRE
ncbi:DUF3592 domain-containing protein [Desulfobacter latus]|uniref:DUF3592 domain-containing protein n=1 Tax=Desulfobacter latus TaxID=2292 RepID=A0A850TDA4_9BACT|nr:DUF3592 domain-containing protein [Desulfobacter latus]NWH05406.1 DUF3592 domain-containing protein [Desulfobacter latus]